MISIQNYSLGVIMAAVAAIIMGVIILNLKEAK